MTTPLDGSRRGVDTAGTASGRRGVRIDPRIRQRRIEVKREEGRRRLRFVLSCLGLVVLVAAVVGATRSPLLDVDHVEVRGAGRTARADVAAAARLSGRPPLLEVDTALVARRVEALPWVLEARATRRWPGTVRVVLTERVPAAVVAAEGGRWGLVDPAGRVLDVGSEKVAGLPVIANLVPVRQAGQSVADDAGASLAVVTALPASLTARVADVATVTGGEVELRLSDPGGLVRLGLPDQLPQKLDALRTLLDKADLRGVAVVDLRVPRAPVLTRR